MSSKLRFSSRLCGLLILPLAIMTCFFYAETKNSIKSNLMSFENSSLTERSGIFEYRADVPIKSSKSESFVPIRNKATPTPNKSSISAVCVKDLGIMTIDFDNQSGGRSTAYGFPFIDEKGKYDVSIDYLGETALASQILSEPASLTQSDFLIIDKEPSLYPIASISIMFAEYSAALPLAHKCVKVPDLLKDGPIEYALYETKISIACSHYIHNKEKKNPTDIINNQNDYADWKFGIGNNLSNNGCGVIAMFNLLFDSTAKPNLALLIALTELCNADLLWGIFGVNPIPDELLKTLPPLIEDCFDYVIAPITAALIPTLSASIYTLGLTATPPWLMPLLAPVYVLSVETIVASLSAVLLSAAMFIKEFIPWYVENMHDIRDVISIVSSKRFDSFSSLSSFDDCIRSKRQGIISFWNNVGNDGKVNIAKGAHTIYIKRQQDGFYSFNNKRDGVVLDNAFKAIDFNEQKADKKHIWGYIINP